MPKPDFFVVGAPKAGTTALTEYLRRHPDIFIPDGKEYHYFGEDLNFHDAREYVQDRSSYLKLFERARQGQRIGEASVLYLYSKTAPHEIKSFQPDAQIVISLRNPVDMIYSEHRQLVYSGVEPETNFLRALERREREANGKQFPSDFSLPRDVPYRALAAPVDDVARYFDVFGRNNVHVVIFEEFFDSPENHYREILQFLEVDPDFETSFDRVNPNTVERFTGLNRWLRDPDQWPGCWIKGFMSWLNPSLRQRLISVYKWINSRNEKKENLDNEVRMEVLEDFRPEINELEELLGKDLSFWLETPKTQ